MPDDDLGPGFPGFGFGFDALAPVVDEGAARSLFHRRRARARRRRQVALGGLAALALVGVVTGAVAVVGGDDEERTPVVADGGEGAPATTVTTGDESGLGEGCSELRVTGPVPEGFSESRAAEGELTDGAGRSIEVRRVAQPPGTAHALEVPWFAPCWLELVGHGVSDVELDTFLAGAYVIGPDRAPMLDPRGAVWPETAQSQLADGPLPDERLSPYETAYAFAREVLGWDDVIEEADGEPAEDGRCHANLALRRRSDPDRGITISLSRAVGLRWWSVCRVPNGDALARAVVEGPTVTASVPGTPPAGTSSASVRLDLAGTVRENPLGLPFELESPPATTGSVLVLFREPNGAVIGAWGEPLQAGDSVVGAPSPPPIEGPLPVVVTTNGVLGWWDGAGWRDPIDWSRGIPVSPGDGFTVVGLDGAIRSAIAGELTSQEFCYPRGTNDLVLDPALAEGDVAVLADWDVVPRSPVATEATDDHRDAIEAHLDSVGITDEPIGIERVLRVDLDGDGTDEELVVATHPEFQQGIGVGAGWYSVVLLRRGSDVRALRSDAFPDGDDTYPSMAEHDVDAIADLNGDGRMEVVTGTTWFESWETVVFDDGEPVLAGACGV